VPHWLIVTGIAFAASLLAALSGGSSSLLTTPAWIALGAPFPTAVAADKVAGTFWTIAAGRTYLAGRAVDRRLLLGMGAVGLVGAGLGALVATALDDRLLRRGAAVFIAGAVLLSLGRRRPLPDAPAGDERRRSAVLLALPLGVYEGVLGSGNGIVTTVLLQRRLHWDLLRALGHYYMLAMVWCGLAALVYFARGALDLGLALPATAGAVGGGALGARMGRAGGAKLVQPLFVAAGLVLAARLFLA
jgi:hypothetical protein